VNVPTCELHRPVVHTPGHRRRI